MGIYCENFQNNLCELYEQINKLGNESAEK